MTNDESSKPSNANMVNAEVKKEGEEKDKETTEVITSRKKSLTRTKQSCLCGKNPKSVVWICCCSCSQWFHCECVSLGGLTKESVESIIKWECFLCFKTPFMSESDDPKSVNRQELRKIVKEEICVVVREELNEAFKGVCTKSDVKSAMKSYVDIVKEGHKEVMEATSGPAAIKEVCKTLNVEQFEREKKKKNVIVSNVPESPANLSGEEKKAHDITYLCHELDMDKEEIVTCFRTGKMDKDSDGVIKPRPVVVIFKKEETATFWHNDKKGFKSRSHWVNPDLCRADREAQYFLRQERRKRQKQVEEKQRKDAQ